jgi:hypothetical protein
MPQGRRICGRGRWQGRPGRGGAGAVSHAATGLSAGRDPRSGRVVRTCFRSQTRRAAGVLGSRACQTGRGSQTVLGLRGLGYSTGSPQSGSPARPGAPAPVTTENV